MYGFLQVMDPEAPSAGQTEPAKGPDSWVGDTLSGTVGIDGAPDTQKNLIVFTFNGSKSNWRKHVGNDPDATPKQPFLSLRPCYPPNPSEFCLPIAYNSVLQLEGYHPVWPESQGNNAFKKSV